MIGGMNGKMVETLLRRDVVFRSIQHRQRSGCGRKDTKHQRIQIDYLPAMPTD